MLDLLHLRGDVAVAGRLGSQRLWDLAERWCPETEALPLREAERALAEQRFRALGVRLDARRLGGAPRRDGRRRARPRDAPLPLRPADPRP